MTRSAHSTRLAIFAALVTVMNPAQADQALRERANALFKPIPEKLTELNGEKIVDAQVQLGQKTLVRPTLVA